MYTLNEDALKYRYSTVRSTGSLKYEYSICTSTVPSTCTGPVRALWRSGPRAPPWLRYSQTNLAYAFLHLKCIISATTEFWQHTFEFIVRLHSSCLCFGVQVILVIRISVYYERPCACRTTSKQTDEYRRSIYKYKYIYIYKYIFIGDR